jgi:hypothetical protein
LLSELLSTYQHLVCPSEEVNDEAPSDFFFIFESSIQHNIVKGISRTRGMIDINNLRQFTCHVIRQQRFGISRRRDKRKSRKSWRRGKSAGKGGLPEAGHKGEQTVFQSKEIMLEIGKKGGQK